MVKMIGDEAMFVVQTATSAAQIGLSLAEAYADDELLSDVRVALAIGPVLVQDGDFYGPVVNLASRLVGVANPGTVLISDELRSALTDEGAEGFDTRALRPRTLKDIGRVQVWKLSRAGSEPGGDRRRNVRWERLGEVLRELDELRERGEQVVHGTVPPPPGLPGGAESPGSRRGPPRRHRIRVRGDPGQVGGRRMSTAPPDPHRRLQGELGSPRPAEMCIRDSDGTGDRRAAALALTLLRSTGMLSRLGMTTRPLTAGPMKPLEGPQLIGPVEATYAVAVGTLDPYRLADDVLVPLATGASFGGGDRPDRGSELTVRGAEVSAVRRQAGRLEVRVFNPRLTPATVCLLYTSRCV